MKTKKLGAAKDVEGKARAELVHRIALGFSRNLVSCIASLLSEQSYRERHRADLENASLSPEGATAAEEIEKAVRS